MTDFARLVMTADSTGLRRAFQDLIRLEMQAGKTERSSRQLGDGMAVVTSRLLALGAGFLSLRGAMTLTDEFTSLSNSIRVLSDDGANVSATLAQLEDIANRTRTPISDLGRVYQRANMAARELGASQTELTRFTENIGLALGLTGQAGASATGALLQLSQALGAGTVRAEEFNSILEGAYPIAQAAARGMEEAGGSVARLRTLVIEGKVSSEEFFRAILSQSAELEAAFAKSNATLSGAFTVLRNNLVMAVGQFDNTLGISRSLATALIAVSSQLDRIVAYAAAAALAFVGYQAALVAATVATGGLTAASVLLRAALIRSGVGLIVIGLGEMIYRLTQAAEKVGGFGVLFGFMKDVATEALGRVGIAFDVLKASALAVWHDMEADVLAWATGATAAVIYFAEGAIGTFKGALAAIKVIWGGLPGAIGDFAFQAANALVGGVESMLNAVVTRINTFLGFLNSALASLPSWAVGEGGVSISLLDEVNLGEISNPFAGAAAQAGADAAEAFQAGFDGAIGSLPPPQSLNRLAEVSREQADGYRKTAAELATSLTAPIESLGRLNLAFGRSGSTAGKMQGELASAGETATDTAAALDDLAGSAGGAEGAGGAAAAMERAMTETEAFNAAMQDAAMTAEELGTARADALVSGIDSVTQAFGDFIATGARDFKAFADSILSSFQRLIADMIATAARNRILIALGFSAPTGAAAATGAASGGGSGFMAALSGLGSSFMGGATSWFSGIGAGMQALSGAASGLSGLAAAVGAAIAPVAALALVFAALRTKTKVIDQGFRLMADGADLMVKTFKETEKSRFFGLSKSRKTTTGAADDAIADPLQAAYAEMQGSILDMGQALGKGSKALKDFAYTITLSTKGMSDEEAAEALAAEMAKMSDEMAKAVLGGTKFVRSGETTTEALARMSASLTAANDAMQALGLRLFNVSVKGADAASAMVDILGGIEGFNQATAFYMQNFYSAEEQLRAMSREFRAALGDMGLAVPKTAQEFRKLVDQLSKAGRMEDVARLLQLAPLFVEMDKLKDVIKELGDNAGKTSEELERANKAESERESLQRRLYEVTGNTAAIRALELAALEPANRALQQQVWALEDAKKALDDLTTDGFATLLDYERAVARARNGVQTGTGPGGLVPLPPPVTTPSAPDSQAAVVVELKAVRAEVARLREEQAAHGKTGLGYGKDTRDILLKFDRTGMPAVRT
jgi:tape measure domain-containing protein